MLFDQGIALRGLFIIDKEGVIQHSTINNLAIGRSVDETMRTLQVYVLCWLCSCATFLIGSCSGLQKFEVFCAVKT